MDLSNWALNSMPKPNFTHSSDILGQDYLDTSELRTNLHFLSLSQVEKSIW